MSESQDAALEKLLLASLARVTDWLKFAEAKNVALLTFSSAWALGILNLLLNKDGLRFSLRVASTIALPLFTAAAFVAIWSFLPRTKLAEFFHLAPRATAEEKAKAQKAAATNLIYFGALSALDADDAFERIAERYSPADGRSATDEYLSDLAVQVVVNSRIASAKFGHFDTGGTLVAVALVVMVSVPLAGLLVGWLS